MARTELTPEPITPDGFDIAFWLPDSANADGNSWTNYGVEQLYLYNSGIGPRTVTIQTPKQTPDGLDVEERDIVVVASGRTIVGPLSPQIYNRPRGVSDPGHVYIDYDAVTSLQVGVLRPILY